jgi:mRNA-degrading endonuclease RelE of RelBE toxin-antitoxin system
LARKAHKARKSLLQNAPTSPYEVDMTATAEAVYKSLYRQAKEAEQRADYTSAHITTFEMVKDAVKRIIPSDPLNRKYALRGQLSNIFRLKKGRMRICWIASSKMRRVCILFVSETLRKEGDANDPYVILQNIVDSGTFDAIFTQFGVRMPKLRHQSPADKPQ